MLSLYHRYSKRLISRIIPSLVNTCQAPETGSSKFRIQKKTYYHLVNPRIRTVGGDKPPLDELVTLGRRTIYNRNQTYFRRIVLPPFEGHKNPIVLLTNYFTRTADEIGEIYRRRWRIELFFKWLKQLLHLTSFLGCSRNAVENQLYIALILALILTYLHSLAQNARLLTPYTLFRHLRNRLFQSYNLIETLFDNPPSPRPPPLTPETIQLHFAFA